MIRLVALAAAVAAPPCLPASATPPPGPGYPCDMTFANVDGEDRALFSAGPLVVGTRAGRFRCTLVAGRRSDSPVVASATSQATPGIAFLPPTLSEPFDLDPAQEYAVCSWVDVEGAGTFRWDPDGGGWTTGGLGRCPDWSET